KYIDVFFISSHPLRQDENTANLSTDIFFKDCPVYLFGPYILFPLFPSLPRSRLLSVCFQFSASSSTAARLSARLMLSFCSYITSLAALIDHSGYARSISS